MKTISLECQNCKICEHFSLGERVVDSRVLVNGSIASKALILADLNPYQNVVKDKICELLADNVGLTFSASSSVRCVFSDDPKGTAERCCAVWNRVLLDSFCYLLVDKPTYDRMKFEAMTNSPFMDMSVFVFDYSNIIQIEELDKWDSEKIKALVDLISCSPAFDKKSVLLELEGGFGL